MRWSLVCVLAVGACDFDEEVRVDACENSATENECSLCCQSEGFEDEVEFDEGDDDGPCVCIRVEADPDDDDGL